MRALERFYRLAFMLSSILFILLRLICKKKRCLCGTLPEKSAYVVSDYRRAPREGVASVLAHEIPTGRVPVSLIEAFRDLCWKLNIVRSL